MKQESKKRLLLMMAVLGLSGLLLSSSSFAGSPAPSQHVQLHVPTPARDDRHRISPMFPAKPSAANGLERGNCSLGSYTMDFGMLTSNMSHDIVATGSVTIHCPQGLPVAIDVGKGASATPALRRMTLAAPRGQTHYLEYQLYTDASGISIWGTGFAGGRTMSLLGTGTPQTIRIYGRITPAATSFPTIGNYSDTLTITLSF